MSLREFTVTLPAALWRSLQDAAAELATTPEELAREALRAWVNVPEERYSMAIVVDKRIVHLRITGPDVERLDRLATLGELLARRAIATGEAYGPLGYSRDELIDAQNLAEAIWAAIGAPEHVPGDDQEEVPE